MEISKKNLIIVIVAALFVIAAIALALVINTQKSSETAEKAGSGTIQSIPSLPESQIAVSPDLAGVKNETQSEIASVQQKESQISEKSYRDKSGRIIGLSDFAKENGIKIQEAVLQNSSQKDYKIFFCAKGKNESPASGIVLQLRRDIDPNRYRELYPKMKNDMKNWEKTIFGDLVSLFFPKESFGKEPAFGETKYTTSNKVNIVPIRYANLTADSGKQYSVDWGFLNDQVFISNDKDCLWRELDLNAD